MARVATLGSVLLLVVALVTPADVLAQSEGRHDRVRATE